jgi:hypothetical protein
VSVHEPTAAAVSVIVAPVTALVTIPRQSLVAKAPL